MTLRTLLIGLVIIVLLFVAGWLTFSRGDGESSINIETERIQQDTSEMVEGGRELIQGVDDNVDVDVNEQPNP